MLTLPQLSFLMLFGALGTLARYVLTFFFNKFFVFPYLWGTTIVNLIGCALFAIVYGISLKYEIPALYRTLCMTGFLGAFTTFSALIHEAQLLLNEGFVISLMYIIIHIVLGLAIFRFVLYFIELF